MKKERKPMKKWKKVLIGVAVAIATPFIALLIWATVDTFSEPEYSDYVQPIEERTIEYDKSSDDPFVEGKIKSTPVKMSSSSLKKFSKYLDGVVPEYEYSDLYGIYETLKLYNDKNITKITKHAHDVRVNGKLDGDVLYKLVLKNNKAYFADDGHIKGMYDIPSNGEIKKLCHWMCEVLTEYSKAYPEIDMDTVCCNLYSFKILSPLSSFSNASINPDNVFNYDKEQMDINEFVMDTDDIYTTTFYHEMVHACQIKCDCFNNYDEWRTGINNDYEDAKVNSLCWYWLTEASAEMITASHLNTRYSTYKSYIGYASSLDFIAQLDKNVGAEEVEKLNFSADMEDVFKTFDIKGEKDRLEFIKMMYSIEVLQMDPEDFSEAYEKKYGKELDRDTEEKSREFAASIKDDALLTLTKLFYRNLARQVARGDVTLQDVYYLMRVWEGKLCYHTACETYFYVSFFHDFYEDYVAIQDEFIKILAKENKLSRDKIIEEFEGYSMNIQEGEKKKSPNCDLKFFNEDEKQYIKDFNKLYYMTGFPSVRENVKISENCSQEIKSYYETTEPSTQG